MTLFLAPTTAEWLLLCIVFFGLGLFILGAEFLRARFHRSPEITRKLVHVLTGVLVCFTPRLFVSGVPSMILAAAFMAINYASIRTGLLKGMHGTNRVSFGTVYYPFSFFVLVLLAWDSAPSFISVSMLVLALADAAAAIVGENIRSPHQYFLTSDKKSLEGSAAMFITSWCVTYAGILVSVPPALFSALPPAVIALAVAVFVTAWEAISSQGLDNLTVPLAAGFVLDVCLTPMAHHHPEQFIWGLVFGIVIAGVSYRLRLLSANGAVATFLMAAIIFGIGGWLWTVPILFFFLASSLVSRIGGERKRRYEALYEKSNTRDADQVAANGGLAAALVVAWYMFPTMTFLYMGFVGAIAAATADTWGTELGTLSKNNPRSIVSFKEVEKGTSGGISVAGLLGGALGAGAIAASALLFSQPRSIPYFAAVTIAAGIVGTLVDSVLGATLQAQYRCAACGKNTERKLHCSLPAVQVRGLQWMTNDVVNASCAAAGAAAAMLVYLL